MRIRFHARTHPGIKRSHNEDNFLVFNRDTNRAMTSLDTSEGSTGERTNVAELTRETAGMLFAVADGVGGANAGEVASAMSVCCVRDYCAHRPRFDGCAHEALLHAHEQVRSYAVRSSGSCRGMGTTLTIAAVVRDVATDEVKLELAHVGNSRAYLMRGTRLTQLTRDQTLAQHLLSEGRLTPEQAAHDTTRHRLLQYVGQESPLEAQLGTHEVQNGDRVLLVTHGVTEHLPDEELAGILERSGGDLSSATALILAVCNERGGSDNITAVLAQIVGKRASLKPHAPAYAALLRNAQAAVEHQADGKSSAPSQGETDARLNSRRAAATGIRPLTIN